MVPLPAAPTWQESTLASIARADRRKVVGSVVRLPPSTSGYAARLVSAW